MKRKKDMKSESPPDEVELIVTQEDYEAGLKRGWTDDDMLKPGRYKFKRGGFLDSSDLAIAVATASACSVRFLAKVLFDCSCARFRLIDLRGELAQLRR